MDLIINEGYGFNFLLFFHSNKVSVRFKFSFLAWAVEAIISVVLHHLSTIEERVDETIVADLDLRGIVGDKKEINV